MPPDHCTLRLMLWPHRSNRSNPPIEGRMEAGPPATCQPSRRSSSMAGPRSRHTRSGSSSSVTSTHSPWCYTSTAFASSLGRAFPSSGTCCWRAPRGRRDFLDHARTLFGFIMIADALFEGFYLRRPCTANAKALSGSHSARNSFLLKA